MEYRRDYENMLDKFTGNSDLLKLIEECILDDKRQREIFFLQNGRYPEQRDLLMKLKFDLNINLAKEVKQ